LRRVKDETDNKEDGGVVEGMARKSPGIIPFRNDGREHGGSDERG